MADIFLSYAKSDNQRVVPIRTLLENEGWSVWMDTELSPGAHWRKRIDEELAKAKAVLVVWSTTSVESDWVWEEANDGLSRGILVPALLDAARIPKPFGVLQATDLTGWRPATESKPARQLIDAVHRMLGDTGKPLAPGEQPEWDKTKGGKAIASYEQFLKRFPAGRYADTARQRIEQLQLTPKRAPVGHLTVWGWGVVAVAAALLGIWMLTTSNVPINSEGQVVVSAKPTLAQVGEIWDRIHAMTDASVFEKFAADFGEFPVYVAMAKSRIAAINKEQAPVQSEVPKSIPAPESSPVSSEPASPPTLPWTFSADLGKSCAPITNELACRVTNGCTWTPDQVDANNGTCTGLMATTNCRQLDSELSCELNSDCKWKPIGLLGECVAKGNSSAEAGLFGRSDACAKKRTQEGCTMDLECEWIADDGTLFGGSCRRFEGGTK